MKDAYTSAFYGVVRETQNTSGYALPESLEAYIVMLLASKMETPNFLPEESFAVEYVKLKKPAKLNAKELGDTCLFVSGVFPNYGKKYGLHKNYYKKIGASSYEMVAETMNGELFSSLAMHFNFLSDFIKLSTTPSSFYNQQMDVPLN